jgi:hypothetical protein
MKKIKRIIRSGINDGVFHCYQSSKLAHADIAGILQQCRK